MKLFKFEMGSEKLGAFKDAEDAYERRTEVDHTYDYLPVKITEVVLEGYEIVVRSVSEPDEPPVDGDQTLEEVVEEIVGEWPRIELSRENRTITLADDIEQWDKPQLREYLDANNIEYVPQWGVKRLKELVLENV